MDDTEEIVRELRKLESMSDDLYLNDVDANWGGSKSSGISKYEKRGGRGALPGRNQGRFPEADPDDLNNFDNWDLEHQGADSGKLDPRRGGSRGRSKQFDRRDISANGAQKPGGRGKPYDNLRREDFETMSNTFDIEGKLQRGVDKNQGDRNLDRSWSRESREGPLYGRQLAMDDPDLQKKGEDQSGYVMHRKDPRLASKLIELDVEPQKRADPRLSQKSEGATMDMYRTTAKDPRIRDDPRLVSQDKNKEDDEMALRGNALGQLNPKSDPRANAKPEQPRGFQNRFMPVRNDPRQQQQQLIDFNKPRPETIFEKISNNPMLLANQIPGIASEEQRPTKEASDRSKRGPRSPSGSVSPGQGGRKDRNGSPGRKRERSPGRGRKNRWERSPSPRSRRERSGSPRRRSGRKERSVSNDRRRSHDRRDWSSSPRRDRQRRDRSPSPRRRRRSRSGSGERSTSAHRTASPPMRGQQRGAQQRYQPPTGQPGYEMPPPAMYPENYQPPPYGAPPAGPLQYPPYQQQQYHYENYGYPQPGYGEYPPPGAPPLQVAPPPHAMPPGWGAERAMMYPDMSQPPPPSQPPILPPPPSQVPPPIPASVPAPDVKVEEAKKEAIKNEVLQQKQTLSKQREEYMRKSSMISRELKLLKDQEETLREENCRDNDRILRENNKLQLEIQNKLKAINNVIDMLTGIIGDKKELEEKQRLKAEAKLKHPKTPPETPPKSSSDSSPELNKPRLPEPPVPGVIDEPAPVPVATAATPEDKKPVFNYVHYDPEMHWCRVCDVFPRTAKEFLNHLHSVEHRDETQARKMVDMPWHKSVKAEEEAVYHKGAPTKRTPIRGLQFFISATAWYCKLCDAWIGDLHCASLHLKSKMHTENYVSFTEQSPHWETDWLADREKAYELKAEERRQQATAEPAVAGASPTSTHESKRSKKKKDRKGKDDKDGKKKKRRKKKKKAKDSSGSDSTSSSSSDDSSDEDSEGEDDKGKSIRVAMRNKMKAFEEDAPTAGYMRPSSGWQSVEVEEEERVAREMQEKHLLEMERREKYLKAKAEEQFERDQAERERYQMQMMQEQQSKFRKVPAKDDKMLSEWMGPNKELPEGERQILTGIRDRVKMRQEAEKDSRKREDRERYYDNRYHEDGNRRRRRGESPEGRSGKRGRSRTPEERRYEKTREGDRRYKRSPLRSKGDGPRFQDARSDSVEKGDRRNVAKRPGNSEQDEAESKFERQAAEAAARLKKKDKKPVIAAIPKSKLPFIGRMPIMKHLAKKKPGEEDQPPEAKEKLPEVGLVMIGPTLPPHLKPPGLVIPEELGAVPQDMDIDDEDSGPGDAPAVEEQVVEPLYEEPMIVAEPRIVTVEPLPEPELLDEIVEEETAKEIVPKKPLAANDIPLPKDFQEALNILFPGQTKPGEAAKETAPSIETQSAENQWSQPPPQAMGYGGPMMGMPPGMHPMFPGMMPGMNGPPNFQVPPPNMMGQEMMGQPAPFVQPKREEPKKEEPARKKTHAVDSDDSSDDEENQFESELSADDLAMLGIDAGDMAAQSF